MEPGVGGTTKIRSPLSKVLWSSVEVVSQLVRFNKQGEHVILRAVLELSKAVGDVDNEPRV